jgi:hypothetical protein
MNRFFVILFIFGITLSTSYSQFLKYSSLAVGLSTSQIMGNNPGGRSIQPSGQIEPYIFGGGFFGAQPGLEFRLTIPIDEERRWRIPVGLDNQFFSAKERIPVGSYIEDRHIHTLNIVTPYIGISYVMQKLTYLKAKTYVSVELRGANLTNIQYTWKETYFFLPELDTVIQKRPKPNTFRLCGLARVGVEGMLFDPIQLNASVGLSCMNLIGRDDTRRELLTPFKWLEVKESYVWNLNFSLLFQYTF